MPTTIPSPPTDWYVPIPKAVGVDKQTQKTLNAIQENLELLAGIRGDGGASLVTAADMVNADYLTALQRQPQSIVNPTQGVTDISWGDSPPPVTNVHRVVHDDTGIEAPWFHHIEWDNPTDISNVYYVEVWASTIDDVNQAQRVGIVTPPANSLMIYGVLLSVDYYYWVRTISYGYKKSTWCPNPDTQGGYIFVGEDTVSETIDSIINLLAGENPPMYDAAITYQEGDRVSHTTGSPATTRKYICIAESTGNLPTDADYWERTGILMIGEVDGEAVVAIDGNLIVDGTILARHIAANQIEAGHILAGEIVVAHIGDTDEILNANQQWSEVSGTGKPEDYADVTAGIISGNASPAGDGLYLGADYLGYYKSGSWVTYMDSDGDFLLGASGSALMWDRSAGELTIAGNLTVKGGGLHSLYNWIQNGDFAVDEHLETDPTAWDVTNTGSPPISRVTTTSESYWPPWSPLAKMYGVQTDAGGQDVQLISTNFIPVDNTKPYTLSAWARKIDGTSSTYLGLVYYDKDEVACSPTSYHYIAAAAYSVGTSWEELYGTVYPAGSGETYTFPSDCKYIKVLCYPTNGSITTILMSRFQFVVGYVSSEWPVVDGGSIVTTNLSSISADLGTITAGSITLDASGFICTTGKTSYADTDAGFWLGYDSTAYKLNLGTSTKFIKWDGSDLTISGKLYGAIAGDYHEAFDVTEIAIDNDYYQKVKEFTVGRGGEYRITWQTKLDAASTLYSRVYRNGVAVGVEKSTTTILTWQWVSDDVSGWSPGDLLQLYIKSAPPVTTGGSLHVKNMIVMSDNPVITTAIATLV